MNITKTLITLFSITLFIFSGIAQTAVQLSKPFPSKFSIPDNCIGKHNETYVFFDISVADMKNPIIGNIKTSYEYIVSNFDDNMDFIGSTKLEMTYDYQNLIMVDNNLILLCSNSDKKTKKRNGFLQVLDITGKEITEIIDLGEIEQNNSKIQNEFLVSLSNDKKTFLVYLKYDSKKNHRLFDKNGVLIWEKSITIDEIDNGSSFSNYIIDDSQNMIFLGTENNLNKKTLYIYENSTKSLSNIPLTMNNGLSPINYKMSVNNGKINIFGFYSDSKDKVLEAKGIFFMEISILNKSIVISEIQEFSKDLSTIFETNKKENNLNNNIEFKVRDIIYHEDGSITFISEYFDKYFTSTTSQNGYSQTVTNFLYHDILVIRINPKGKISWITRIPKKQHVKNEFANNVSYLYFYKNNMLYIAYNENEKNIPRYQSNPNLTIKDLENLNFLSMPTPMIIKVQDNGEFTREQILEWNNKINFNTSFGNYLRGEEFLLIYNDKKSNHIARLKVN